MLHVCHLNAFTVFNVRKGRSHQSFGSNDVSMLRVKSVGNLFNILAAPSRSTSSLSLSHHNFGSSVSTMLRVRKPGDLESNGKKLSRYVSKVKQR